MDDTSKAGTLRSLWDGTSSVRQIAIVVALVGLLAAVLVAGYLAFRPNYQVLFADLRPQDAATIVAELGRQKIDHRLADGGATVLVPAGDVHTARLKIMSRDLPLKGTVGFELFNNADLGLTEFAQKVNYQRALQGELARTIMSLAEIESARVHLSLPESGLFRRAGAKPRASVALLTRGGQELPADAVKGIQRLVAAAVPELEPFEVTIVDPRGAPMAGVGRVGEVVTDRKLELKIELERYYLRKLTEQLTPIVGQNNASISVDVALNFDQIRITQESVGNGTRRRPELAARPLEAGLVSSDRAAIVDDNGGVLFDRLRGADGGARRVEQIVASPGSVRRINVGVLLHVPLDPTATEQVRQLVIAAAGLSADRGDAVAVFARERFSATAEATPAAMQLTPRRPGLSERVELPTERPLATRALPLSSTTVGVLALAAVLVIAIGWLMTRRGREATSTKSSARDVQLARLRQALQAESTNARA